MATRNTLIAGIDPLPSKPEQEEKISEVEYANSPRQAQELRRIGPYEILGRPLGTGGMASVYKVLDPKGEVYAAKVLSFDYARDRKKRERFISEYEVLEQLDAHQIVKVHELIENEDLVCIIMDFVEGKTLKHWIKRFAPFPEVVIFHILGEISRGLLECHSRGFCHRDLKPENIIITSKGEVKILDFGIVRDMDMNRTLPGTVLGTLDYMAPEQINPQGKQVDFRADLYSLGIMSWEMLTRRLPIIFGNSESIVEIYEKKRNPKLKKGSSKSPLIEGMVEALMSPDPEDRAVSVEEILTLINDYMPIRTIQRQYQGWLTNIQREIHEEMVRKTQMRRTLEGDAIYIPEPSNWAARARWVMAFLIFQAGGMGLLYHSSPTAKSLIDGFMNRTEKTYELSIKGGGK